MTLQLALFESQNKGSMQSKVFIFPKNSCSCKLKNDFKLQYYPCLPYDSAKEVFLLALFLYNHGPMELP